MLNTIFDWSEVWGLLIPLAVILAWRFKFRGMKPIVLYVVVALVLNSFSTVSYVFHEYMRGFLKNNNIFYNLHSIARVVFFGWFIYSVTSRKNNLLYQILFGAYTVFVLLNFILIESPLFFSTWIFAAESIILLLVCILFFQRMMQDDSMTTLTKQPSFLVTTGVMLYETITFFIFLFILPMAETNPKFGLLCLKLYKLTFVVLCILLALSLYKVREKTMLRSSTYS